MKQTAALYARVSTRRQEEEETIASQIAAIESYAQSRGYVLKDELYFVDEAVSGAKLDRPALDRLRDQVSEGSYEVVVCLCPDRLARRYPVQVLLLEEFKRAGIEIVFVNQPPGEKDAQSDLLFGIQGLFAEYERTQIAERMRRGRLHRARQGQMLNAHIPYGFRYIAKDEPNGRRWELEPDEAAVVRQIFAWYTQANSVSFREIATWLNASQDVHLPRYGKLWGASTVGNILRQCQYTGQGYYNRTQLTCDETSQSRRIGHGKRANPARTSRPQEEWITIPVPVIIDQETWLLAQERLITNRKFAIRNNQHHPYLLRGLLICATCGHTLIGRRYKTNTCYTCTYGNIRRPLGIPVHTCAIPGRVVEPLVWQAVIELLQNPQLIARAWDSTADTSQHEEEQSEKERLENRLRSLDRQQERLLDLFQEDQLDKSIYLERKQRLQQERQTIQNRIQHFSQQERLVQVKQHLMADFEHYCQRIQTNLANPTPQLQQEVIRLLIDHVVVGNGEIVIKHIVPTDDDCRLKPQHKYMEVGSIRLGAQPARVSTS